MPDYTAIAENSSVNLAKIKKFLRLDESDTYLDDVLKLMLLAAKQAADNYCQDTFSDSEGNVTIPAEIDLWVMQVVSLNWERKNPFIVSSEYKDLGSTDWEYNYDDYFHMLKAWRREVGFGPF